MADARQGKILIVEDDLCVARLQERRLALRGYQAIIAATPAAALEAVRQGGIELILLDYCLPNDVTGLDFYADLKAAGYRLPVIMVTARSDEATILRALRSGAQDFVTKSAEYLEYLPEAVERVLHQDRLAKQLAESEERFHLVARATNDVVWDWDLVSNARWWNEGFGKLFGYQPEQIEPSIESWYRRLHAEDKESTIASVHAVIDNGGHFWSGEYRLLRGDGSYANILDRGYVIHDGQGRPVRMIGSMMDITERKRAEERLREQAALIQAAQDAIIVLDMEDRVTFWNPRAERLYGWSASEALGRPANELLYSECLAELSEARRMLHARGEWSGELRQVSKSAQPLVVESRWTLIADELGRPRSLLIVNTDITEKKNLQSQVLHAQRMESVGTLAGGVAHEFNNLLQAIRGYTQYGMQGLDPSDQRRQDLEHVLKATDRASALTRQLLSFGRRQRLERLNVDPNQVVDDTTQMIRPLIGAHIDVQLLLGDNVPHVNGDAAQLQQVLMNLCINARDAMPAGGRLLLKTEQVLLTSAFCSAHPDFKPGSYAVLTIADTGCGMSAEIRQRVFEPFFTTKEVGEGTGLGLAMAYGIVQQHEGAIHVFSEPGKGTTFKIFIPAAHGRFETRSDQRPAAAQGGSELILIADDEPMIRELAARTLQAAGYRTLIAADGEQAVQLFSAHADEIALVLLDGVMPKMNGRETYQLLRTIKPQIRAVFCSGYGLETGAGALIAEDGLRVIAKPFDPEVLLRTVREELNLEERCLAPQTTA